MERHNLSEMFTEIKYKNKKGERNTHIERKEVRVRAEKCVWQERMFIIGKAVVRTCVNTTRRKKTIKKSATIFQMPW